jgi:hypothetical protein
LPGDDFVNRTKKTEIGRRQTVEDSETRDPNSKKVRIEKVAMDHAHDLKVTRFYHWGGMKEGNTLWKLLNNGVTEGDIQGLVVGKPSQTERAGPGLYLSSLIYDSADYCDNTGGKVGCLVEVTVTKGAIGYIDLVDRNTRVSKELKSGSPKVNVEDVYSQGAKILCRYVGTWYCLKTIENVTFRLFDGSGHKIQKLAEARPIVNRYPVAKETLERQLDSSIMDKLDAMLNQGS